MQLGTTLVNITTRCMYLPNKSFLQKPPTI